MSMVVKIPAISREYVWVPVTATGDDAPLLTTLPVEMAFLPDASEPTEDQWQTAEWSGPIARCLIGSGSDVVLPPATYTVWVRVTGATERPVRPAGKLRVT